MVATCHLGGLLRAWVGVAGFVGIITKSEMGGISGFLLYFRVFIALTHEWADFVRRLVAVQFGQGKGGPHLSLSSPASQRSHHLPAAFNQP